MANTLVDAFKSLPKGTNASTSMLMEAIATSDEVFSLVPWVTVEGPGIEYDREATLPTVEWVSDTHTSLTESTGTQDHVTVGKREIASDFYIRNASEEYSRGSVSPSARQTQLKLKAAGRTIADNIITGGRVTGFAMTAVGAGPLIDTLVSVSPYIDSLRNGPGGIKYTHVGTLLQFRAPGDADYGAAIDISAGDGTYYMYSGNVSKWIRVTLDVSDATGVAADLTREITFTSSTNEFDGLATLMHPGQIYPSTGAAGDEVSFELLDRLGNMVKGAENPVYMVPQAIWRKLRNLMRAGGGVDTTQLNGKMVMAYGGVPILLNDYIPATESKGGTSTLSSVYLVDFSAPCGVYMIASGGSLNTQASPFDVSVMGLRLFELGQIQGGPSAFGRRLCFFGALAMGSYLRAARASEIITV